jgi:TRAP-type C4-dicarboxylate transport system permease large subunit
MKKLSLVTFTIIMLTLTSCQAIGDIFSAGFYTGLFVVLAVIVLIVWLVSRKR